MSERTPPARRVATRIVPIRRLETPATARRIPPSAPLPAVPVPVARARIAGARLANTGRFYRPTPDDPVSGHSETRPDSTYPEAPGEESPGGTGDPFALRESHDDPALLVIWDQPPTPEQDAIDVPRWVSNVELMPDEAEFAALGQYLVSMIDGFANFCQAPGVSDSGNWQARLPMPPAVLPETVLDMSLSPVHARLHFETEHPVSRAVLHRYVDGLRAQVREALEGTREVEVALW